jgi:hypothetical protein
MEVADFDYTEFQPENLYKGDEHLYVRFFTEEYVDETASLEKGATIFKTREMVGIRGPGQSGERVFLATPRYTRRFPKHYKAFKQRIEMPEEGTPLIEWGGIPRNRIEELSFLNIKTVEQLANVADSSISNVRGGLTLKTRAQEWLKLQGESKKFADMQSNMQAELKKRDEQLAQMQEKLAALEGGGNLSALATDSPVEEEAAPSEPPTSTTRRRRGRKGA